MYTSQPYSDCHRALAACTFRSSAAKAQLEIFEKVLGPEHPRAAQSLNNLAALYYAQGKYEDAEPLQKRALEIFEKVLGPEHPKTATSLKNYSGCLRETGRPKEAEELDRRAGAIRKKAQNWRS